jgi:hypothetical protein
MAFTMVVNDGPSTLTLGPCDSLKELVSCKFDLLTPFFSESESDWFHIELRYFDKELFSVQIIKAVPFEEIIKTILQSWY